jgi:thioredoxin 2
MADASNVVRCPHCGTKNRLYAAAEGTPRCAKCKNALPWIASATETTFEEEAHASVPVVVDFWAAWCAPCRMVQPVLERFATSHAGRVKVVQVDVDAEPALAQRYQAMSIPLLVLLRDGEEVERIVGAAPDLERRLESSLTPASVN